MLVSFQYYQSLERAHPTRHAACVPHWCNFELMWQPWKKGLRTVQTGRNTQSWLALGWSENIHRTTRNFSIELLNFEWFLGWRPPSWSSSAPPFRNPLQENKLISIQTSGLTIMHELKKTWIHVHSPPGMWTSFTWNSHLAATNSNSLKHPSRNELYALPVFTTVNEVSLSHLITIRILRHFFPQTFAATTTVSSSNALIIIFSFLISSGNSAWKYSQWVSNQAPQPLK